MPTKIDAVGHVYRICNACKRLKCMRTRSEPVDTFRATVKAMSEYRIEWEELTPEIIESVRMIENIKRAKFGYKNLPQPEYSI